jgi:uncharacterized protein
MATLTVKVVPGASRSRIAGRYGDALKIQVAAAPERGKANQAVIAMLATVLGVPRHQIELVAGQTQPRKTFRVHGMDQTVLDAKLAAVQ